LIYAVKQPEKIYAGIDVGGSHISIAAIDEMNGKLLEGSLHKISVGHEIEPLSFINQLAGLIKSLPRYNDLKGIGFSFPGPFDYENGTAQITGLSKFENLYGLNIRHSLQSHLRNNLQIRFENDATCFVLGEYFSGNLQPFHRVLGLTLGTGFGSTFLEDGKPVKAKDGIPEDGYLYHQNFKDGIADDYFSTRWLKKRYHELTGNQIAGGRDLFELAQKQEANALEVFDEFGHNLCEFLLPYLQSFNTECLIIGGNISKAWDCIMSSFQKKLDGQARISIHISKDNEESPLIGAAMLFKLKDGCHQNTGLYRKTSQHLKPAIYSAVSKGKYDMYPAFEIPDNQISEGYGKIADYIINHRQVVMDGYIGTLWDDFIAKVNHSLMAKGRKAIFLNFESALKPEGEIDKMVEAFMGEQGSIFGKRCTFQLIDFFDKELIWKFTQQSNDIWVLYGCGSGLSGVDAKLIYLDLPKNELQYRMRASKIKNLGKRKPQDSKQMYKRFYFVDWIVFNRHKHEIFEKIDLLVDGQDTGLPLIMQACDFKLALEQMAKTWFRVRPWFEPGAWGGSWMKSRIPGLAQDVPNYAWSFEMIVPENGIMLKSSNFMFEASFDFLMFSGAKEILGRAFETFGFEFPIRFDFLDTFDGGNLSIQCHPRPEYIRQEFGENFTQDETYYILDTKDKAVVYLGFQENIDKERFKLELEASIQTNTPVEIEKYIQAFPSNKHDLFLIPNGTIHGSGKNNLVLEISSTPYIFTFKMYDWLRLDLDGQPRPINIDHAFVNLYFQRKGKRVQEEFISRPEMIEKGLDYEIYNLPTHPNHFYEIERMEFETELLSQTNDQCHVCMLVEGEWVVLKSANGRQQIFNYAETFAIPAAAHSYKLVNETGKKLKVVRAFIKNNPNILKNEIDN
jgi:predicted NBD/HSP70 family sugar kinase/mannose-6-phosphate isomerase class I